MTSTALAQPLRLAVASNFAKTIEALKLDIESSSQLQLQISLGSSGKHYAQILHGAPFDIFLAADSERPARLAAKHQAAAASRFTYALGQLVLWQPGATQPPQVSDLKAADYLALANPKLAPYGAAAAAYLRQLNTPHQRLVYGENISQSYHFAASGQAKMALIAYSQVADKPLSEYRLLSPSRYPAIQQQAVIIKDSEAARRFMQYLQSARAQGIIQVHGYLLPALQ